MKHLTTGIDRTPPPPLLLCCGAERTDDDDELKYNNIMHDLQQKLYNFYACILFSNISVALRPTTICTTKRSSCHYVCLKLLYRANNKSDNMHD